MDKPAQRGVPKIIFIMIPVILASMYYYAAFVDTSAPEKTVQEYYQAYFAQNYETVASDLSVFLAAQALPQYASLSPQELLAQRDKIETDMASFISKNQGDTAPPQDISVEVLKGYTRLGKNAAVVAFSYKKDGKEQSLATAFLVKEKNKFRIYDLSPIARENLNQVKTFDINGLDAEVTKLLQQKSK